MSYADTGSSKKKKAGKTQREIVFGSDARHVSAKEVYDTTRHKVDMIDHSKSH